MANTKTAKKEIRKNARRYAINRPQKTKVATYAKRVSKVLSKPNPHIQLEDVMKLIVDFESAGQKLAKKNIVNKKKISRKVSRFVAKARAVCK